MTNSSDNTDVNTEVVAHELGHAIDLAYMFPGANASASATYNLYTQNDLRELDYSFIGDTPGDSTPRPPCSNDGSAPFDGVVAFDTGEPICDGDTLAYEDDEGLTNSAIAQNHDGHIFSNTGPHGWAEFYAQQYAFAAWGVTINIGTPANASDPTLDGLVNNGYLTCTDVWASDINLTNTTGGPPTSTVPAYCSNSLADPWTCLPFQPLP